MVGVLGITLDFLKRCDMPVGWKVANNHNKLKYQAIHIGLAWEDDKMDVYTKLKAYCLNGKELSWIKAFDSQKDVRHNTENLQDNYEGADEVNTHVAWVTAKIENDHFMSKHTYSFEKF